MVIIEDKNENLPAATILMVLFSRNLFHIIRQLDSRSVTVVVLGDKDESLPAATTDHKWEGF